MVEIEKSAEARLDLIEIYAYLVEHAGAGVADRFNAAARDSFEAVARMPGIGTPYDSENPELIDMRWWLVSGFHN